jgi:hypothetical protein
VAVVRTSDIFDKAAQLVTESSEDFILVLDRFCNLVSNDHWVCVER